MRQREQRKQSASISPHLSSTKLKASALQLEIRNKEREGIENGLFDAIGNRAKNLTEMTKKVENESKKAGAGMQNSERYMQHMITMSLLVNFLGQLKINALEAKLEDAKKINDDINELEGNINKYYERDTEAKTNSKLYDDFRRTYMCYQLEKSRISSELIDDSQIEGIRSNIIRLSEKLDDIAKSFCIHRGTDSEISFESKKELLDFLAKIETPDQAAYRKNGLFDDKILASIQEIKEADAHDIDNIVEEVFQKHSLDAAKNVSGTVIEDVLNFAQDNAEASTAMSPKV